MGNHWSFPTGNVVRRDIPEPLLPEQDMVDLNVYDVNVIGYYTSEWQMASHFIGNWQCRMSLRQRLAGFPLRCCADAGTMGGDCCHIGLWMGSLRERAALCKARWQRF